MDVGKMRSLLANTRRHLGRAANEINETASQIGSLVFAVNALTEVVEKLIDENVRLRKLGEEIVRSRISR